MSDFIAEEIAVAEVSVDKTLSCAATRMFQVKDVDKFVDSLEDVDVNVQIVDDMENPKVQRVYLYTDSGAWPNERYVAPIEDGGDGDIIPFDLPQHVAEHLKDGEVAIFEQVSFEGKDSLAAVSEAINPSGKRKKYTLDDFADSAVEELGGNRNNL